MREVTAHKVNGLNEALAIMVLDEPGQGGACHEYEIRFRLEEGDPGITERPPVRISFQNGPIKEAGVNGISQEALLAIVIDRLQSFQAGDFACIENGRALQHAQFALDWLHKRTNQRLARGVEGTNQV